MNKIVREHYPVERLPEDLRERLPSEARVRITLELEQPLPSADVPLEHLIAATEKLPKRYKDAGEVVSQIRSLRDEWNR